MIRPALLAGALALAAIPAHAQDDSSATVKLIQLLIEKGILTKGQATDLLSQARTESRPKPARASGGTAGTPIVAEPPPLPAGTVRVTYVPQSVRDQLAAQVRDQILGEEEAKGYASPNALPEWTKRITVYGDLRGRLERDFEDRNNYNEFTDFNSINNGSPFDSTAAVNGTGPNPPLINTTESRNRIRLRARLGVKAQIDDWIGADIRVATGENNSPVSTNQTLGSNFDKYQLWLDRAYIILDTPHELLGAPDRAVKAWVGRTPNPFWTTDLQYAADLNFDGVSVQSAANINGNVRGWLTAGAFPVFNTDFNYSTLQVNKYPSHDKYLFAGQAGVDLKITPDYNAKFAVGLFDYENIQGKFSSPCDVDVPGYACNTDDTRTQFKQNGNTLFSLRDNFSNQPGVASNPQYFGLASNFDVLDLHGLVQWTKYAPLDVTVEGEFVKNLAYNRAHVLSLGPVNNSAASSPTSTPVYSGGDTGYYAKIEVGTLNVVKANQWNAYVAYKYLETDSVVDSLTDSDFHLGGTNAKGFIVGGNYGVGKNTYCLGALAVGQRGQRAALPQRRRPARS